MLKNNYLISCIFMSINILAAPVCNSSWGQLNCGKGSVNKIDAQGIVSMNNTIVSGKSNINGTLNASHVNLNTLNAKGMSIIEESTINGVSQFVGSLLATNSKFKDNMYITSESVDLASCKAKKLIINNKGDLHTKLKLHGNTTVQKVVFKKTGGEVWLYDNAKVIQPLDSGKLINK